MSSIIFGAVQVIYLHFFFSYFSILVDKINFSKLKSLNGTQGFSLFSLRSNKKKNFVKSSHNFFSKRMN